MTNKIKPNFYAVAIGKKPGIYSSWDKCSVLVTGFPGAKFKGHETRQDALAWMHASGASVPPEEEEDDDDGGGDGLKTDAYQRGVLKHRGQQTLREAREWLNAYGANPVQDDQDDEFKSGSGEGHILFPGSRPPTLVRVVATPSAARPTPPNSDWTTTAPIKQEPQTSAFPTSSQDFRSSWKPFHMLDEDVKLQLTQEVAQELPSSTPQDVEKHYNIRRTQAMKHEIERYFFTGTQLAGYQALCRAVRIEPSWSVDECRADLRGTLVNIIDLIVALQDNKPVRVWDVDEWPAFRNYTKRSGNRFDLDEALKSEILTCFLQVLRGKKPRPSGNPRPLRDAEYIGLPMPAPTLPVSESSWSSSDEEGSAVKAEKDSRTFADFMNEEVASPSAKDHVKTKIEKESGVRAQDYRIKAESPQENKIRTNKRRAQDLETSVKSEEPSPKRPRLAPAVEIPDSDIEADDDFEGADIFEDAEVMASQPFVTALAGHHRDVPIVIGDDDDDGPPPPAARAPLQARRQGAAAVAPRNTALAVGSQSSLEKLGFAKGQTPTLSTARAAVAAAAAAAVQAASSATPGAAAVQQSPGEPPSQDIVTILSCRKIAGGGGYAYEVQWSNSHTKWMGAEKLEQVMETLDVLEEFKADLARFHEQQIAQSIVSRSWLEGVR